MLVQMQRPGARYVLSRNEWVRKYGREIKPNARPVIILVPFGPVDFLFDIADTYNPHVHSFDDDKDEQQTILDKLAEPYRVRGNVPTVCMWNLCDALSFYSIYADTKMVAGAGYAAKIELIDNFHKEIYIHDRGTMYKTYAKYLISINKDADDNIRFASMCHELAHLFCYHLCQPKGWDKLPERSISDIAEEFEAESVAYLICERLNVINPSKEYLAGYLSENIPNEVSIERIFSAFNEIWRMLQVEKNLNVKDGYCYKYDSNFREIVERSKIIR